MQIELETAPAFAKLVSKSSDRRCSLEVNTAIKLMEFAVISINACFHRTIIYCVHM